MVTCDQQEQVAFSPKALLGIYFYKYKIYFEVMLNYTLFEWVGVNSNSMIWPAGTGTGLYKQIVVTN